MNNMSIKKGGSFYYRNDFWFSPAYQSLLIPARELLHCLFTELRWTGKGRKKEYWNNGDISYTETSFRNRYSYSKSTYIKARNQLIIVGIIKQTYRGGNCRGDRATYKILLREFGILFGKERWKRYPQESWENDIPKPKKQLVGVDTQWELGQSGRKTNYTLSDCTLNDPNPPIKVDPKISKPPIKIDPKAA